jgi:PrsW family intramembrane metalloprotease
MIVALIFAHVWGVIQLIVLGSFARTVRVRTVLMALAVGLYACAPLAVFLQMAWIRAAAWLTDVPVYSIFDTAGYTANPSIEEMVKVLPIAALLLIPAMRRQWSLTDCVLAGAAVGSGFGLAESLFRFGQEAHRANSIDQGWALTNNISFPVIPGVWSTVNSWLPEAGVPWGEIPISGRFPPSVHLVWSALGGLAVGLIMLRRGWLWRTLGAVLLVYVAVDHTAWNAAIRSQHFAGRTAIEQFRTLLWLAPILALALAWWLDRKRQHVGKGDEVVLLALEQSASPRLVGTLRAAFSRLPWSLPRVYGFVRMRRAYNSERTSPLPSRAPADLSGPLVQLRDRIDRQLGPGRSSPLLPPGWSGALMAALRRPIVIVWLLLMVPSVMWFVIGGLPQTAALQKTMTQPLAWKAIIWLSVLTQAWLAWRVVYGLRTSKAALRLPSADDAALFALRAVCGVGAIGLGGHALMRSLSGVSPNSSLLDLFNGTEAYASGTPATTLQLADGASAAVPPDAPINVYDLPNVRATGGLTNEERASLADHDLPIESDPIGNAIPGLFVTGIGSAIEGVGIKLVGELTGETAVILAEAGERSGPGLPGFLGSETGPIDTGVYGGELDDAINVNALPNALPDAPINVHDLPDAPINVHDLANAPINVHDLPNAPINPPDFQHGSPTRPTPDDPHVAPDPNAPPASPPEIPYRAPSPRPNYDDDAP